MGVEENLEQEEGSQEGCNDISDEADERSAAAHSGLHTEPNSSQTIYFAANPSSSCLIGVLTNTNGSPAHKPPCSIDALWEPLRNVEYKFNRPRVITNRCEHTVYFQVRLMSFTANVIRVP